METKEIIKEIMETNELCQMQLAKILCVSQKCISNWINGINLPNGQSLLEIYKKFGITPNEVLGVDELKKISKINFEKVSNCNFYIR